MKIANWKWTQDIEKQILKEIEGIDGLIVHICSATSGIGDIRIDRWAKHDYEGSRRNFGLPNIVADYRWLPIKSASAAAVICDPPYSPERRGKEFPDVVNEIVRIAKSDAKIIWVCPWILYHKCIEPKSIFLHAGSIFPSYKILSISKKTMAQLEV
jgi:hypothetical protein